MVEIDGELVAGKLLTDVWTDIKVTGIADEGGVKLKNGKKPERLIKRILDIATVPGDIVCDFFGGSGTTAAVAHKMGRTYITIEQMDYVEDITLQRLKNVIAGDLSGISSLVKWKGGGEVIYCELAKANQIYVDLIQSAKKSEDLLNIWEDVKANSFISYRVDPRQFDENIKEFKELSLDNQRKFMIEILDKNMLYIPLSEIDDSTYQISQSDIEANKNFFKIINE